MLKIMLIGDSIRMNYEANLRAILQGKAAIDSPEENCRFSAYTLFSLASWVPDDDYDIIHWNNGQWDTCYMPDGRIHTSLQQYLDYQQRIAQILKPKGRRLIFATTTPVHDDQYVTAPINGRKNQDITAYNAEATKVLADLSVEINDLHSLACKDINRYISEDKVHLSSDGVELCSDAAAKAILAVDR